MRYDDWYSEQYSYVGERIKRAVQLFKYIAFAVITVMLFVRLFGLKTAFAVPDSSMENYSSHVLEVVITEIIPHLLMCGVGYFLTWFICELLYSWADYVECICRMSKNVATIFNRSAKKEEEEKKTKKTFHEEEKKAKKTFRKGSEYTPVFSQKVSEDLQDE